MAIAILICVVAVNASAESPTAPLAVEFADLNYNPYPIPGIEDQLRARLQVNVACTVEVYVHCRGGIVLADTLAAHSVHLANAGTVVEKDVRFVYSGEGSARIEIEVVAQGVSASMIRNIERAVTFFPEREDGLRAGMRVGVYFDEAAQTYSLPDSTSFPFAVPAYVVLTDYDEPAALSAWDLRLHADPGLFLMDGTVHGVDPLNIATFPSFSVGLATPTAQAAAMVIASFNVLCLEPGYIYLEGVGDGGHGNFPHFVTASGTLGNMTYAYGDPLTPVASVGNVSQPSPKFAGDYRATLFPEFGDTSEPPILPSPDVTFGSLSAPSATDLTYNVSVAGKLRYGHSSGSETYGVLGSKVIFRFVNPATGAWWHPSLNVARHIHYDILDEEGSFSFDFSFVGDLSRGGYTELWILLSPENDGAFAPAPASGYRVWMDNRYYDLLNEVDGIQISLNPVNPNISYYSESDVVDRHFGAVLRNSALSREFMQALYGGPLSFSLPKISMKIFDIASAGSYYGCNGTPYIVIDPDNTLPTTIDHEYGHHVHHSMWGWNCSYQWNHQDAKQLIEGWADFFTFCARNYAQRQYGREFEWGVTELVEEAPYYANPRFRGLSYTGSHPEYSACACLLWNLYDGSADDGFEAPPYSPGDNDDIEGYRLRVFESLRTMNRYTPALHVENCLAQFSAGLAAPLQAAASTISDFMYADLYSPPSTTSMHSAQATGLEVETPHRGRAILRWGDRGYPQWSQYRNLPERYRVYRYDGDWVLLGVTTYDVRQFVYEAADVAGLYKVTAYKANSGESVDAPEATVGVSGISAPISQATRIAMCAPNPSNPRTTIGFEIAAPGRVRMSVFDVSGTMVRSLVDDVREPGTYTVIWDGDDGNGRAVSSGLYFARLSTDNGTDVHKITLLR